MPRLAHILLLFALPLTVARQGEAQEASIVPERGFYLGIGGGFGQADFGSQDVYAIGTSDIYSSTGALQATGSAAGPATVHIGSDSTFFPTLQGGYFQKVAGSDWLWGAKFSYSNLDTTVSQRRVLLPQAGSFTYADTGETVPFTGNAVVGEYRTSIDQQAALMPYVGRSFTKGFLYLGAGPTLSHVQTDLDALVGFADINGNRQDISGAPVNFSESSWVSGGAIVIGGTYFFDPQWFVDVSYTYGRTSTATQNYASPFSNPGSDGSLTEGTLVGDSSGRVTTQSFAVTLNWVF